MLQCKKIVIIGPESTGKSTLTEQLGHYFNCPICPEYARTYLKLLKKPYNYEDLLAISIEQLNTENQIYKKAMIEQKDFVFIDSGMIVKQIWCEFVFNKCYPFILEHVATHLYDGILLCSPDIDWVQDGLREYPDEGIRLQLFEMYKVICIEMNIPWTCIKGKHGRIEQAIQFIKNLA